MAESIHAGVHFPSMASSHMEVKAGTWEEWTLIHSSRQQDTDRAPFLMRKNIYFRKLILW